MYHSDVKRSTAFARWALLLYEYNFEVVHRAGITILDADGLSRNPRSSDDDLTWCIPLFTAMEWSSVKVQSAKVFHLARRILERKASLPSLTVAQTTMDIPVFNYLISLLNL